MMESEFDGSLQQTYHHRCVTLKPTRVQGRPRPKSPGADDTAKLRPRSMQTLFVCLDIG